MKNDTAVNHLSRLTFDIDCNHWSTKWDAKLRWDECASIFHCLSIAVFNGIFGLPELILQVVVDNTLLIVLILTAYGRRFTAEKPAANRRSQANYSCCRDTRHTLAVVRQRRCPSASTMHRMPLRRQRSTLPVTAALAGIGAVFRTGVRLEL